MIHPISSLQAKIQKYRLDRFESTSYSRKLKKFKNRHCGESCFIIGNGPSLTAEDLELIHEKNIPTFAFNRIYLMFDKTSRRPTYYISQDEMTLKSYKKQISDMDLPYKFIPLQLKYYFNIRIDNALYFKMNREKNGKQEFSEDISKYVGDSNTVAYTAAQFAVYMGFKKIYLIGVDHSFSVVKNDKGEIIRDENAKDYFTEEYNRDKEQLAIPNLDASTRAYLSMKENCDRIGVEVYNATRGGKLEVFPRVDFDAVMENWRN